MEAASQELSGIRKSRRLVNLHLYSQQALAMARLRTQLFADGFLSTTEHCCDGTSKCPLQTISGTSSRDIQTGVEDLNTAEREA